MHHTAFVPHSWVLPNRQPSRTTACALMSDRGYLLIQAFFLLGICHDPNFWNEGPKALNGQILSQHTISLYTNNGPCVGQQFGTFVTWPMHVGTLHHPGDDPTNKRYIRFCITSNVHLQCSEEDNVVNI